jgi:hypothetical protein
VLSVEWALSHLERFVARRAQVALDYDALSTLRTAVLAQQTTNSAITQSCKGCTVNDMDCIKCSMNEHVKDYYTTAR